MPTFDVDGWEIKTDEEQTIEVEGPEGWIFANIMESASSPGLDVRLTTAANGTVVESDEPVNDISRENLWAFLEARAERIQCGGFD